MSLENYALLILLITKFILYENRYIN